jgi:hypothetical protein
MLYGQGFGQVLRKDERNFENETGKGVKKVAGLVFYQ